MTGDVVIRADSLGKKYLIGHDVQRERYTTLREVIARKVRRFAPSGSNGSRTRLERGQEVEEFWALKEINLEIKRGEVVGIIGRNGAGKSTLLKILSRITEPSEGRVEITGRVASLLEVGTGFHPELTGRENIYVNGAILGMSRAEVRRKFDEIVAFADVERFLDTPVKRYSSGMHVRLAFSVAAHMEPEILIVDEVLAVGDAAFQEKCIGKMNAVAKSEGRTVLFVSHNMSVIQQLCKRCILLEDGKIRETGEPSEVVGHYLSSSRQESNVDIRNWLDRTGSGEARVVRLTITDDTGSPTSVFPLGSTVCFHLETEFYEPLVDPCFGVVIHASSGEPILDLQSAHQGLRVGRVDGGVKIQGTFPNIGLYPGTYFVSPWITDTAVQRSIDFVRTCCSIEIIPKPGDFGDLRLDPLWGRYWVNSEWKAIDPLKTETRTHMFYAKSPGN